jgi:hypothetical protein
MSEDPIGFAAGDANLYRYVGNSPTNFVDPNGLKKPNNSGGGNGMTIWELEAYLESLGAENIDSIIRPLEEAQEQIEDGGGAVYFLFPWNTPGKDGYRCSEADELVEDKLRPAREDGWEYSHQQSDGLIYEHNWGEVIGPNGETFYIDFWSDPERPFSLEPPITPDD